MGLQPQPCRADLALSVSPVRGGNRGPARIAAAFAPAACERRTPGPAFDRDREPFGRPPDAQVFAGTCRWPANRNRADALSWPGDCLLELSGRLRAGLRLLRDG